MKKVTIILFVLSLVFSQAYSLNKKETKKPQKKFSSKRDIAWPPIKELKIYGYRQVISDGNGGITIICSLVSRALCVDVKGSPVSNYDYDVSTEDVTYHASNVVVDINNDETFQFTFKNNN